MGAARFTVSRKSNKHSVLPIRIRKMLEGKRRESERGNLGKWRNGGIGDSLRFRMQSNILSAVVP